ncbi:MAG: bifunctional diaminohydroxyphosphoribosylaminopyrimidine deaminase/5-amino-6-(5-phosphoribosylamino)uracil reductase RibD [Bacteroidaceae bacterium]|nr:bifunctional diaminohydroxyphosphoribosylaminopyrimidine deaminase/5-amino-6-(5-phosphoribosylamino)uracil reductase RibD [Bacteroidaceae bacterium]
MKAIDELYMRRCIQLARCGVGSTSPNPAVGAVIVCDGRIIGEGYHIRAGEPHAEVNAVRSVKESNLHLLPQSTMYVTLEPCSHYGKTPPCCDMIIEKGIKRVVIGSTDNNECVNGAGISRMRKAGIDVVVGVLEDECMRLNQPFFTFNGLGRPAVTLKWAQTADGFIDVVRNDGKALCISTTVSQVAVHKLRSQHDAILVGTRTALLDNPSLNLRCWSGRSPLRLVIDRSGVLPATLNLFDGSHPTVVYTQCVVEGKFGKNVEQVVLDFSKDILPQILSHLYSMKVNSLFVEGGARLLQSFIDASLWDNARVEVNHTLSVGDGVSAPHIPANRLVSKNSCGGNEILLYSK